MQQDVLIELKHISKTFANVRALNDVGFSIKSGSVHALMGENGAGKSTLIKILTGVYTPDEGAEIVIDNKCLRNLTPIEAVKNGIAVTYQDFSLFPNLTVIENIGISKEIEKNHKVISWKTMREAASKALERIDAHIDMDAQLGLLSAAKQQLVAIARALVYNAKLLILDEPTSTLSSNEVKNLLNIIFKLKEQGISILFISHKIEEVFEVADQITVLRDGNYIGTYDKNMVSQDDIISFMVGRKVQYIRQAPQGKNQKVALEIKNFSKKGNFADISFKLYYGEILALTGLVGAGRTEVCQAIYGITKPDSGQILLEGEPVKIKNAEDATRKGIAFVPEDRRTQGLL